MATNPTPPFFILGCVRSGTTLLRDLLRRHPNLASPEETQFYRWPSPFGTELYRHAVLKNVVLKKHRQIDGFTEEEFERILAASNSRAGFYLRYMKAYISRHKPGAQRWFDKSPQNVYGAAMIAAEFPKAKFVHIVRNPMDVVSSLRIGKIVKVAEVVGACSYWNEAAEMIFVLKRAFPGRVYEVKYEDFTSDLLPQLEKLLAFLGEDFDPAHFQDIGTRTVRHEHATLFSDQEREQIERLCARWMKHYAYAPAGRPAPV